MITKEITMGASVFISANGYMRACACSQVLTRAYERKEDSDEIARFLRPVATSVHTSLKNADQVLRQDAYVPRQE